MLCNSAKVLPRVTGTIIPMGNYATDGLSLAAERIWQFWNIRYFYTGNYIVLDSKEFNTLGC